MNLCMMLSDAVSAISVTLTFILRTVPPSSSVPSASAMHPIAPSTDATNCLFDEGGPGGGSAPPPSPSAAAASPASSPSPPARLRLFAGWRRAPPRAATGGPPALTGPGPAPVGGWSSRKRA